MPRLRASPESRRFGIYLGRVLRAQRKRRGIKAHAVAEDVGVAHQTVSAWETGKMVPELRSLFTACQAIGVPTWRVIALAERAYKMDQTMTKEAEMHGPADEWRTLPSRKKTHAQA